MKSNFPGPASDLLISLFTRYSAGYLRRHFHALRLAKDGRPALSEGSPVVIYTNHAAWWDPLVGLILKQRFFSNRRSFVPIDAQALNKYKFFRRLGFFPVERGSMAGARQFLEHTDQILAHSKSALWITPQGKFADARQRPARFEAGLGRLASRADHALFLPLAIEYVFWEERLPEILVRFGSPTLVTRFSSRAKTAREWTQFFEQQMEKTQDGLAASAIRRNPAEFENLLVGKAGVGGAYDWWRQARAWVSGKTFRLEHGTK